MPSEGSPQGTPTSSSKPTHPTSIPKLKSPSSTSKPKRPSSTSKPKRPSTLKPKCPKFSKLARLKAELRLKICKQNKLQKNLQDSYFSPPHAAAMAQNLSRDLEELAGIQQSLEGVKQRLEGYYHDLLQVFRERNGGS